LEQGAERIFGYTAEEEAARVHPAARSTLPRFYLFDRLDGQKILVVDDEPDTRDMLKAGLGQCGASVVAASSAAEALEAIEKSPPDLLISDIGMPEEDGYDLMRRVRGLPADAGDACPPPP
jgi:CheY-like chemotaxis protein